LDFVIVHSFSAETNEGDVTVVFEELVLETKEGAKEFRVLSFEGTGNEDEIFVTVALFNAGSEEIDS
jgi:hypothetical protein